MFEKKLPRSALVAALVLLAASACASCGDSTDLLGGSTPPPPPPPPGQATIVVDPATRLQTLRGWEVNAYSREESPAFDAFKNELFDRAVNEAGINRLQLPVRSGVESDQDYWALYQAGALSDSEWRAVRYATVNDNNDPTVINPNGFHFAELDDMVNRIVLPVKQRLAANGEALHVTLTYVAFTRQITTGSYHHATAAEYAEFILAVFQHLQSQFGLVPNALEIILEPDNVPQWTASVVGAAIVAVTDRLSAAGFTPEIIAPSTTSMANAPTFFTSWPATARARVHTVAYHRYSGVSAATLQAIAALGKETAMLEWWNANNGYQVLHEDLKAGRNSAWQQGTLGASQGPMTLYRVDASNPAQPVITINDKTKFTRQYFKYVRGGAVRIGATSTNSALDPLAFVNPTGGQVVVVKATGAASFTVGGLAAGTYGISYATTAAWGVEHPAQTITAGQTISTSLPGAGVLTIYRQ